MHKMKDGTFVIEHVARGHWSALEREQKIKTLASVDSKVCASYELVIEQEPVPAARRAPRTPSAITPASAFQPTKLPARRKYAPSPS